MIDRMNSFLETAQRAADEAGRILERYARSPLDVKTKGEHYNLVTAADVACERKIVETIRAAYPDHNILAEEAEYGKTDSPFTWVIDPIDGTSNFAHGFPHYSVSIALARDNAVVLGLVLDPGRGERFWAVRGEGARLNGQPISVTRAGSLTQSLLATGFHYGRGELTKKTLEKIGTLLTLGIMDIRRTGSAALDLCYVASGRVDGYFEYRLNPWDFAAGALILEEAGGRVTDWEAAPLSLAAGSVAATNGRIHDELLKILNEP